MFQHRDRTYAVTISPARVNDLDDSQRDYYPSTTEELVEEALRKLAIDQYAGFFDNRYLPHTEPGRESRPPEALR